MEGKLALLKKLKVAVAKHALASSSREDRLCGVWLLAELMEEEQDQEFADMLIAHMFNEKKTVVWDLIDEVLRRWYSCAA